MDTVDSMLKAVPIGLLIRSIFAGGFFVISFYLTKNPHPDWTTIEGKTLFDIALPVSLFVGVLVYGIQRALFYPLVELVFESKPGDSLVKFTIKGRVIDTAIWRWNLNVQKPIDNKLLNEQLNRWADHIHTQYSVFLCIIFGSLAAWGFDTQSNYSLSKPLFWTAVLFLGSGLFNNARHYAFINGIKAKGLFVKKIKSEDSKAKPNS
jgi:hypothetical protein